MGFIKELLAPITGFLATLRSFLICRVRLKGKYALILFDLLRKHGRLYSITDEITDAPMPTEFRGFGLINGIMLTLDMQERFLRAGFQGTDTAANVHIFRWNKKKFRKLITKVSTVKKDVPVYLLKPWDADRIGEFSRKDINTPYIDEAPYQEMDNEVQSILKGKKGKTGILLYGTPGNGKTYLIKHFSAKYGLPIYIVSFNADMNNHDVIKMFGHIKGPAIVLFEDFCTYFNKRKPLNKEFKFTFDTVLNVIDGVYTNPNKLIFIMTANKITNIDDALKKRPSRFKEVHEIGKPNMNVIAQVFPELQEKEFKSILDLNLTLDELLDHKERFYNEAK